MGIFWLSSYTWGTVIHLANLSSINPELYEAASVDGAIHLQKIWYITLPMKISIISSNQASYLIVIPQIPSRVEETAAKELALYVKNINHYSTIDGEIKFFSNYSIEDDPEGFLPEELEGIEPDNVYQFHFKNLYRHLHDGYLYGFSIEEDSDSSLGKVGSIKLDNLPSPASRLPLTLTSKEAENTHPIKFQIQQNSEIIGALNLYLEDVVPGEYKLYKIGSVAGIKDSFDTRINLFSECFDWFSLTGVSVVFPMDECDVYISMKFEGSLYGGSEKEKDSICIDRMIVVRKG